MVRAVRFTEASVEILMKRKHKRDIKAIRRMVKMIEAEGLLVSDTTLRPYVLFLLGLTDHDADYSDVDWKTCKYKEDKKWEQY
jgi:hypothetical protein